MKEIEYNPTNPDYINKSQLIYDIAGGNKGNEKTTADLLNFGRAVTLNSRISNKQTQELVEALHTSKVLTYFNNFIKSGWNSDHIDGVKSSVENDGKLQALILSHLYQFNDGTLQQNMAVDLLQCLLYRAHKLGFHEIYDPSDIEIIQWRRGLDFLKKSDLALIKNHKNRGDLIDINTYRFDEEYDKEMIEKYRKNISMKKDVYDKLSELEGVAYLGFAMGLRDGSRSQARYWDKNCEDF